MNNRIYFFSVILVLLGGMEAQAEQSYLVYQGEDVPVSEFRKKVAPCYEKLMNGIASDMYGRSVIAKQTGGELKGVPDFISGDRDVQGGLNQDLVLSSHRYARYLPDTTDATNSTDLNVFPSDRVLKPTRYEEGAYRYSLGTHIVNDYGKTKLAIVYGYERKKNFSSVKRDTLYTTILAKGFPEVLLKVVVKPEESTDGDFIQKYFVRSMTLRYLSGMNLGALKTFNEKTLLPTSLEVNALPFIQCLKGLRN